MGAYCVFYGEGTDLIVLVIARFIFFLILTSNVVFFLSFNRLVVVELVVVVFLDPKVRPGLLTVNKFLVLLSLVLKDL